MIMIKFSILGKLLYRQKQTILLPLFHCALYCCSVMINIGKVDTIVIPWKLKCQSPSVSNKIHYPNYNVSYWLAQVALCLSFLNIERKAGREKGWGWRMIWVSWCTFYFYQRPASADCTQTNKLLHLNRKMIEQGMLYETFIKTVYSTHQTPNNLITFIIFCPPVCLIVYTTLMLVLRALNGS